MERCGGIRALEGRGRWQWWREVDHIISLSDGKWKGNGEGEWTESERININ